MIAKGNAATVALIAVFWFASGAGSAALAPDCPLARSVDITEPLVLYSAAPEPWWFFPLVLSTVEEIGLVDTGQRLRICETVERSTWRERSLWVRVIDATSELEEEGENGAPGGPPTQGWVNVGPVDLNSFLTRQNDR